MLQQKTIVCESGERYCLLLDRDTGVPFYYPNLYITSQVRNRSLSLAAMELNLNSISVFLWFLKLYEIDIASRVYKKEFLSISELDSLSDLCQKKLVASKSHEKSFVSSETTYIRLSMIANYFDWLSSHLLGVSIDGATSKLLNKTVIGIRARRPTKKSTSKKVLDKGLTIEQLDFLFEVLDPQSAFNPFKNESVKVRNRLIFLVLYHFGLRAGELLNLRIRDINFSNNQLKVIRRHDDDTDPRKNQPLVKTRERTIPVNESLINEIYRYITKYRTMINNSSRNDFLFVTHQKGYSQGHPLSKSTYKAIVSSLRRVSPVLQNFNGHQLRHSWNELFSVNMDSKKNPVSHEDQEKIRSYLMGWKEGSGTAAIYNQRFIKNKANEAMLSLQKGVIRKPLDINDEE